MKLILMNALIEKVLYLPPECKYSGNEFTGPLSYHEMYLFVFLLILLFRKDPSGNVIPMIIAKPQVKTFFTIVYSHANAEDISQL